MKKTVMARANKLLAVVLTAAIAFSLMFSAFPMTAEAQGSYIYIDSVEDFVDLAKKCSLDTWSQGKTVILENDIDFKGTDFKPIPTFGGTFDGRGHSISGVKIKSSGSVQGIFRYVQKGGEIKNLKVDATLAPGGSKSNLGGICGINSGSIVACTFYGNITGTNNIGGIAGQNTENGTISGCSAQGEILGEKCTGGICGSNKGLIQKCDSNASINTVAGDTTTDTSDAIGLLDKIMSPSTDAPDGEGTLALENTLYDMGGIAGYSEGVIQNCENSGEVGYKHIGYNVGGIVGRQEGFVTGCTNSGKIYGRKDVGGIVGQMEPYVIISSSSDNLSKIRDELDVMQDLIDTMLNDVDNSGDSISDHLHNISDYAGTARTSSKDILDRTTDFIDTNVDELNDVTSTVADVADQMVPVLEDAQDSISLMEAGMEQLKKTFNILSDTSDDAEDMFSAAANAVDDIQAANKDIENALDKIHKALQNLSGSVYMKTGTDREKAAKSAASSLAEGLNAFEAGTVEMSTAVGALEDSLKMSESGKLISDTQNYQQVISEVEAIRSSWSDLSGSLAAATGSLNEAALLPTVDWTKLKESLKLMGEAFGDMRSAVGDVKNAVSHIKDFAKYGENVSKDLEKAFDKLSGFSKTMSRALDSMDSSLEGLRKIAEDLANKEPIKFEGLGDGFKESSDSLFDSLEGISSELSSLQDSISASTDLIIADVRKINRQFNSIMDLIIDTLEDLRDGGDGLDQYVEDTSDENISGTRLGKVSFCENLGAVEADKNTGGIAGTMAIELELDPEDDIFDTNPLTSVFETRAVMQDCVNRGSVTGKKDCTGGDVGRMDLGTIVYCESYANISGTDGDYVGGVAGYSNAVVRNCYAKGSISGQDYVGGIVGNGENIKNCGAIVKLKEGSEFVGAIAGYADVDAGECIGNYFVSDDDGGIDGISYSGKAEPVTYSELAAMQNTPLEFKGFTVTFVADDETVDVKQVVYGDELAEAELPEVPEKRGCYGQWPAEAVEPVTTDITVEAEYEKWVDVIGSPETPDGSKKSIALAEGQFTKDAEIHAVKSILSPPHTNVLLEQVDVWELSIIGSDLTETDSVPVRLLNQGGGKVHVWEYKDGNWTEIDAEKQGQYMSFYMQGTEGIYCIASTGSNPLWARIICVILAAVITALGTLLVVKKRRKRRAKKAAEKEKSEANN